MFETAVQRCIIKFVHHQDGWPNHALLWHTSSPQLTTVKASQGQGRAIAQDLITRTHRYEAISFRPPSFRVHDQLNVVNLSEGLEYSSQHFLGDVEVKRTDVQAHRSLDILGWRRRRVGVCQTILLSLCVLNGDRDSEELLTRQSKRQCHRLWIFELDVRNSLEAFRLVACDETNILHLSDAREELLQVAGSHSLRQLHAENCSCVSFFWRQIFRW